MWGAGEDDAFAIERFDRTPERGLVHIEDLAQVRGLYAHLKNFSLRYADPRRPVLSPAYDVVSVAPYPGHDEEMALSLARTEDGGRARLAHLDRLGVRAGLPAGELGEVAARTVPLRS